MKSSIITIEKISRLLLASLMLNVICMAGVSAQTTTVYARVVLQKVAPEKVQEFLTEARDIWKPAHRLRQQNGKITNWALYLVHFTGVNDEYNYASVSYYNAWEKTEGNDNWAELMKGLDPRRVDVILAKTRSINVRHALYSRVDGTTTPPNAIPAKYFEVDYMKAKGAAADYEKVEQDIWKPIHQTLVNDGNRASWTLWRLEMPGGTGNAYDYATANAAVTYKQLLVETYEDAFKKAHPGKNPQAVFDSTLKSRDLVKREIWELVDSLN
ncbi:MAG: hypothetical protein WEB30_14965 [Cyclobacteriaceae bacterium]